MIPVALVGFLSVIISGKFGFSMPIGDGLLCHLSQISFNLAAAMSLISTVLRFSPCISFCAVIVFLFVPCLLSEYRSIVVDGQSLVAGLPAISDATDRSFRS